MSKGRPQVSKLERAYELGHKYEMMNWGCSQCAFAAVLDVLGYKYDSRIFRSTTSLCGGGGLTGEGSCGAFSGGCMAISYKYGRGRRGFKGLKAGHDGIVKPTILTKKLYDKFMGEYGSVICRDIQKKVLGKSFQLIKGKGDDIVIDMDEFEKAGGHGEKGCPTVVGNAARWTVGILLDDG